MRYAGSGQLTPFNFIRKWLNKELKLSQLIEKVGITRAPITMEHIKKKHFNRYKSEVGHRELRLPYKNAPTTHELLHLEQCDGRNKPTMRGAKPFKKNKPCPICANVRAKIKLSQEQKCVSVINLPPNEGKPMVKSNSCTSDQAGLTNYPFKPTHANCFYKWVFNPKAEIPEFQPNKWTLSTCALNDQLDRHARSRESAVNNLELYGFCRPSFEQTPALNKKRGSFIKFVKAGSLD